MSDCSNLSKSRRSLIKFSIASLLVSKVHASSKQAVLPGYLEDITASTLPSLGSLKVDSLDPVIDAETMDLHFNHHHFGYRTNLLKHLGSNHSSPLAAILQENGQSEIQNFGGGHLNHQLFWAGLGKSKLDKKGQILLTNLGYTEEQLVKAWKAEANSLFGSGWSFLCFDPLSRKLRLINTLNQDNPITQNLLPIMGIDLWEHAYYLKYRNRRSEYVDRIWEVMNWQTVSKRISECLTLAA